MFSIIEHIEYLMTCHDCVVVPGWGAFIANYCSARYDEERSVMSHPRRTLSFNADIAHNDGLLVQSIMRREGMGFDEALRFIADSVAAFKQQLAAGNEVSMGRLGHFRQSDGRCFEFVPFGYACGNDAYFGLADLEIQTVDALERGVVAGDAVGGHVERNPFVRRATRVAASIAVLIGLGITLTTPIVADREHREMATMAPKVTAPQAQRLDVTVQQDAAPQSVQLVESEPAFGGVGSVSGKYYMIIATLRNQMELDAFKRKYAELVPYMKIMDYRGMMCVYVARSDDYSTLLGLRDQLPKALRNVWIYG